MIKLTPIQEKIFENHRLKSKKREFKYLKTMTTKPYLFKDEEFLINFYQQLNKKGYVPAGIEIERNVKIYINDKIESIIFDRIIAICAYFGKKIAPSLKYFIDDGNIII